MKNVVIFGDSYSTFMGEIPKGYGTYYPSLDVTHKEDTWWYKFFSKSRYNLLYNDSWTGATIGYTGYDGCDCSNTKSFIARYRRIRNNLILRRDDIDLIIIFGATNDSWANAPLGDAMLSNWEEKDLYNVLPAISYFINSLKNDFPKSEILFIINTELKKEISDSIISYSKYFKIKYMELHDIEKINGHPTSKGMTEICDQVLKEVF